MTEVGRVAVVTILLCIFVLLYHITHMDSNFLKKKYDLHNSPEVESAVEHEERKTGEKLPNDPEARIEAYLDRLQNIIEPAKLEGHPNFDRKERNLELVKGMLHKNFVIKPEEIPEGYFENQKKIMREQGHGDVDVSEEQRVQLTEVIIADQESSLDKWIDYLASGDATYPNWLKYYAVRSILGIGEFDKEKKQFSKRSKGTTKPFPDLNREALAYVLDILEKKYKGENIDLSKLDTEDQTKLQQLLQSENFGKLYAFAIEKVTPESKESLENVKGKWIKYDQNSDHMPLVESLQGHGTGWCTAGESTAQSQLKKGDFYVYYSEDKQGNPTIPRAAIRMNGEQIGEVRGVAKEQNLDPYIGDVVKEKLKSFPDGNAYEKKSQDMRCLTEIEKKTKTNQELTKEDLVFLYEVDSKIEGFGYDRDPRIEEIRNQRNPEKDMLVVFDCDESQTAKNTESINENTRSYLGPLTKGIFEAIQKYNIEHIYTSFPDGKIRREALEVGGKTVDQLIQEMKEKKIKISDYAVDMLESKDFVTSAKTESLKLVRLKVGDLGFPKDKYPTTDEIYKRIQELGLELCPPEVGPNYRLKYADQPMNEWIRIGMKQIADRDGNPSVFYVGRYVDGLWLSYDWAKPANEWFPDYEFVFCLRKL